MKQILDFFEQARRDLWSGRVILISTQGSASIEVSEGQVIYAHRAIDRSLQRWKRYPWLNVQMPDSWMPGSWPELMLELLKTNPDQQLRLQKLFLVDRREVFLRCFFWSNIEIRKQDDRVFLPDPDQLPFYTPMELGELIEEAKRRLQAWPALKSQMGSSKRVFVSSIQNSNLPDLIEESLSEAKVQGNPLPFSVDELELLRLCDGHHSVLDLVQMLPYGEYLTIEMILSLQERGALRSKERLAEEGSVVHTLALSVNDVLNAVVTTLSALVLTIGLHFVFSQKITAPCDSRAVQQALEIYRSRFQYYPLTLNELPKSLAIPADLFSYSLMNPVTYELSCRSERR